MPVSHPLLARRPARETPSVPLLADTPQIALAQARVHEASGPARRSFAIWLAARTQGPVFWIAPAWAGTKLNSEGVSCWMDPARLLFVSPKRSEDLLWTMEEILRSGAVALAVVDLPGLPSLTQVRRMHLAAETGSAEGSHMPLGLLLTPGQGGAAGVESRWNLRTAHIRGQDRWTLERSRARTAPPKTWQLYRTDQQGSPRIKTA